MIDVPSIGAVVNWLVVAAGDAAGSGSLGKAAQDAYNGLRGLRIEKQGAAVFGGGTNQAPLAIWVDALPLSGQQRAAGLANYLLQVLIDRHEEVGDLSLDDLRRVQARLGELIASGITQAVRQSAH